MATLVLVNQQKTGMFSCLFLKRVCIILLRVGGGGNLEGKVLGWEVSLTYLSDVHSLFDSRIL